MRLKRELVYFGAGLAAVFISVTAWLFWYYPTMGHDHASGIPALFELRDAWQRFGVLDIDFSAVRCLGLPNFSSPNSLSWSLPHFLTLAFPEVYAFWTFLLLLGLVSYFGAYRLCRGLGVRVELSFLLAMGWCLQGYAVSHVLPGHATYIQFLLWPLLLWIVLQEKMGWLAWLTAAYWVAHLFYTSGFYLFLVGVPAILASAWILQTFLADRLRAARLGGLKRVFLNLLLVGPLVALMIFSRILGAFNFTSMYPRLAELVRIDDSSALLYTLSNYFYPFPYDVKDMTGWWYGNWESYEFILPGFAYFLIWIGWRKHREVQWPKALGVFLAIVLAGTVLSSGLLAPVFHALPVFKSLHVNPRWNGFVILPFFALALSMLVRAGYDVKPLPRPLFWFFALAFFATPFFFIDKTNMAITYPDGAGIDRTRARVAFCYEPLFGYGLENFPLGPKANWMQEALVDPRCYLKSSGCPPGSPIQRPGVDPDDDRKLRSYALREDYAPVRVGKPFSVGFFLVGMIAAFAWLGRQFRDLWRRAEDDET